MLLQVSRHHEHVEGADKEIEKGSTWHCKACATCKLWELQAKVKEAHENNEALMINHR